MGDVVDTIAIPRDATLLSAEAGQSTLLRARAHLPQTGDGARGSRCVPPSPPPASRDVAALV